MKTEQSTTTIYRKHLKAICILWTDPRTGNISHSKFWNNIACAAATVTFIKMGVEIKIEFFQWYLGLVGFQALASKFIALKLGGDFKSTSDSTEVHTEEHIEEHTEKHTEEK